MTRNSGQARTRRFLAAAGSALLVLLAAAPARPAAADSQREQLIRGALVYKFAKFVRWPDDIQDSSSQGPLVIGVLGDDSFAELISRKVEGLRVRERPVEARSIASIRDASQCHILVFAPRAHDRLEEELASLKGSPVLTVGRQPDFLEAGGMINLFMNEGAIGFQVNLPASREVGLELNARLLQVAAHVEDSP